MLGCLLTTLNPLLRFSPFFIYSQKKITLIFNRNIFVRTTQHCVSWSRSFHCNGLANWFFHLVVLSGMEGCPKFCNFNIGRIFYFSVCVINQYVTINYLLVEVIICWFIPKWHVTLHFWFRIFGTNGLKILQTR